VGAFATGFRMSEKMVRGQGYMLSEELCTRLSPKMSTVPGGPFADTSPPSSMSDTMAPRGKGGKG